MEVMHSEQPNEYYESLMNCEISAQNAKSG